MKMIEADKTYLDQSLGLSCVENYYLYIMTYNQFEYRPLYANSFVSAGEIARAFCEENTTYAYFNKISRLQETSSRFGIISLTFTETLDNIISTDSYCCIRVARSFFESSYARELWRGDHYMLLCSSSNGNYLLINDIPRDEIKINQEQLFNIFDGKIICFEILKDHIPEDVKEKLLKEFLLSLSQTSPAYEFAIDHLETARDILGILRVTRKRIQQYSSLYLDTDFMTDHIQKIDKTYAMFEYMRLRNRFDYDKVNQSLFEIQENDFRVIDKLNREMRVI